MSTYSTNVSNATLSTANDALTLVPAASRRIQLVEISVGGMGTASAANELGVFLITTAGTTGGGAPTINKMDFYAPTAASTLSTTWSAQPTVGGQFLSLPVNSNGGLYRWVARPGEEINVVGGLANSLGLSFRAKVGTGSVSLHIVWIEDPL